MFAGTTLPQCENDHGDDKQGAGAPDGGGDSVLLLLHICSLVIKKLFHDDLVGGNAPGQ